MDGGDYIFLLPTIAQKRYDDLGEREDEDDVAENLLLMLMMLVLMLKPSILKPIYQSFQAGLPCIGLISISPPPWRWMRWGGKLLSGTSLE